MACQIIVLGDSSSSGIGLGRGCYPAKLFGILQKEFEVQIVNYAVPGATSADVSRFFHTVAAIRPIDFVIIYLGNNEGAAGVRKGYYHPFKTAVTECFSRRPESRFQPILSPPRFRFDYRIPSLAVATTPEEFRNNLRLIARRATKRGASVIIVNPVANHRFPCGVGAPNSSYFAYLDNTDRLGFALENEPIDMASESLATGLDLFSSKRFDEAYQYWDRLASIESVAGFIARHNLACARARMGDNTAEAQLKSLLGVYDCYDSMIYYNLAQLKRLQGDQEAVNSLLNLGFENDRSVYRIRQAYRDAIASFTPKDEVRVLDLESILKPSDFIDYCHPTDEGHEQIARALANLIRSDVLRTGLTERSFYEVSFPTPNYLKAPGQTLLDYYCIDWPIDQDRIGALLVTRGSGGPSPDQRDNELAKCILNFRLSNSQHPIFTTTLDLVGTWAPRSHEILSYPEYFLYRLLYNYSLAFEKDRLDIRLSAGSLLERFRFSAADYKQLILRHSIDSLDTNLDVTREYYDTIVNKIRQQLLSSDQIYRVTIGERIRTVTKWFTREAFRYGTQSRTSMLYPRWSIEMLLEGLIVAIVIANRREEIRELVQLDSMVSHVLSLLQVHEHHASVYHRDPETFSTIAYEAALREIRHSIRASVDGGET